MNRAAEQTGSLAVNDALYALVEGLTDRLQRREEVRLEEVISAHPEHADGLRRIWPSLELMAGLRQSAGSQVSFPPGAGAAGSPLAGEIGDFRIIREVGRGGMGIVYEAEQMSLGRRVALKMLPFGGVLDERQLQRFRNEARAAAGLHHPHIVPVHAVGCERGVHFYAMQFIAGRNLAELLDEIRTRHGVRIPGKTRIDSKGLAGAAAPPVNAETQFVGDTSTERDTVTALDPCTVARWIVQAARALDYAHAVGIVHRDIKPSNLLLDAAGQLWITDFGLAQFEADAGLTQSGDILGTLRYMSPEQALGARAVVDQRADVYSLGATLYELLTLAPLYPDAGRAELLRCIEEEEPQAPRRGNPAIPVDLETIVIKSLAKDPAARYATAAELADDLQRFLQDQPIRARRTSFVERVRRWSRRRRALVSSVIAGLVISVIGLTAAAWLVTSDQQARERERLSLATQTAVADVGRQHKRLHDYVTHINLADRAIRLGRHEEARRYLDLSWEDGEGLRGFEWHYLAALSHPTLRTIGRHAGQAFRVDVDPSGSQVLSCGVDGVRVWDADTGKLQQHLIVHADSVRDVRFAPDGSQFLTAGEDGTARIWDSATLSMVRVLPHDGGVGAGRFTPDGQLLLTMQIDPLLRNRVETRSHVWDATTGQQLKSLSTGHDFRVSAGDLADDGLTSVTGDLDGNVLFHRLSDGEILKRIRPFTAFHSTDSVRVTALEFAHQHPWLAIGGDDGTTLIWSLDSDSPLFVLSSNGLYPECLAFAAEDRFLLAGNVKGAQSWMLLADGHFQEFTGAPFSQRIWSIQPFRSASALLACESGDIFEWNLSPASEHFDLNLTTVDTGVVASLSPDGRWLATGGTELILHDLQGNPAPYVVERSSGPQFGAVAFSPDGRELLAGAGNVLSSWRVPDRTMSARLTTNMENIERIQPTNGGLESADLEGNAAYLTRTAECSHIDLKAFECKRNENRQWVPDRLEVRRGEEVAWQRKQTFFLSMLHFSPDGRWLAVAESGVGVEIHDALTGELQGVWLGSGAAVKLARFSPNSQTLALVVEPENSIALWNTAAARPLLSIPTGFRKVSSLEFSADSRRLLIAGTGATSKAEVLLLSDHGRAIESQAALDPADEE